MKRAVICLVTAIIVIVVTATACARLYEDSSEIIVKRPNYNTEIPANPTWDSIPQPESPIGK